MVTTRQTPLTARGLLELTEPFGPAVEDGELVFDSDPPIELEALLPVLHTGVRALLSGRRWYGERSDKPGLTVLNPARPIPGGITLLCVEEDGQWDRIHRNAWVDFPHLFETERPPGPSRLELR
jgi:hypothetical protein